MGVGGKDDSVMGVWKVEANAICVPTPCVLLETILLLVMLPLPPAVDGREREERPAPLPPPPATLMGRVGVGLDGVDGTTAA
jgi:hypothetical protein